MARLLVFIISSLFLSFTTSQSKFFCTEYDSLGRCLNCIASYLYKNGYCYPPEVKIPNCLKFKDMRSCSICNFGFELKDGACVRNESYDLCLLSNSNGNCLMCIKGVMLVDGRCDHPQTCKYLPNCNYCALAQGLNICIKCKRGYTAYLTSEKLTTCVPSLDNLNNCWLTTDGNKCESCSVNYYLFEDKCIKSPTYEFDVNWLDD